MGWQQETGTTFRASLRVTGFGRVTAQPLVSLPAQAAVLPGDDPSLRCSAYWVPPIAMLGPILAAPKPDVFYKLWITLSGVVELTGVCTTGGVGGGLALLSALERSRLTCIFRDMLPAQGGFQAAYFGRGLNGEVLALLVSAQLLPAGTVLFAASPGRVVCRVTLRSSTSDVVATVKADPALFATELFGDALAVGVDPDAVPPPPAEGRLGLHPSVAPLRKLYALPATGDGAGDQSRFDSIAAAAKEAEEPGEPIPFGSAVLAEWRHVLALSNEP
eukprot:jgi/Botrbrau1/22426/Bobra.0091s0028.1